MKKKNNRSDEVKILRATIMRICLEWKRATLADGLGRLEDSIIFAERIVS